MSAPRNLIHAAGPELMLAAVVIAGLMMVAARSSTPSRRLFLTVPERRIAALLIGGYVVYAAVIAVEGVIGSLIFARFALAPTALLVALVSGLLVVAIRQTSSGVSRPARAPRAALIAVAGLVIVVQLPFLLHARHVTGQEHDRYDVARSAIVPGVPCRPVAVPNANFRAYAAVWSGVRGRDVIDAAVEPLPGRSTRIDAQGREPLRLLRDPSFRQRDGFPAATTVRRIGGWTVSATCSVGG